MVPGGKPEPLPSYSQAVGANSTRLSQEASKYLELGASARLNGDLQASKRMYLKAVEILLSVRRTLKAKAHEEISRKIAAHLRVAEDLDKEIQGRCNIPDPPHGAVNLILANAKKAEELALETDRGKAGDKSLIASKYKTCAALYLKALKQIKIQNMSSKHILALTLSPDRIRKRCSLILDRIENLSEVLPKSDSLPKGNPKLSPGVSQRSKLSEQEKALLIRTSTINKKVFPPWVAGDEATNLARGHGASSHFYDDLLPLAPQQRTAGFKEWVRPQVVWPDTKLSMVSNAVSALCVRQTVIGDCSFCSSIAIAAHYERRFGKRLITRNIFPKNCEGKPVYNPHGKYLVTLYLNGVARKVLVDDRLPIDRHGNLLCSFSSTPGELWVSIMEKAFLKAMGGYDFPGSNSGVDMHVLTGWIPEYTPLQNRERRERERNVACAQRAPLTETERSEIYILWKRMKNGSDTGDCLLTASTGAMHNAEAVEAGLVPSHAYAILRVEEVRLKNSTKPLRLLQLKNPWGHLRWKGKFCPEDDLWTQELKEKLQYNPSKDKKQDNGIFWISLDSLCRWFASLHFSWNKALFPYRHTIHESWPVDRGPMKDAFSFRFNPQFKLQLIVPVKGPGISSSGKASTWLLLSRHVTNSVMQEAAKQDDELHTSIALHVLENDSNTASKKIADLDDRIYTYSRKPFVHKGVYTSSQHCLVRLHPPVGKTSSYVVVVSQLVKREDLFYTLHTFSTVEASISRIPLNYKFVSNANGKFNSVGDTRFSVTLGKSRKAAKLSFQLTASLETFSNIKVTQSISGTEVGDSGAYSNGFCMLSCDLSLSNFSGENLVCSLSTYPHKDKEQSCSAFSFSVSSTEPFDLQPL